MSLILFLTMTSLRAEDIYIKVMSARYKDTLFDITAKFHFMGYKMHLYEYEDWYRIYTGPFKSMDDAENALIVIRNNGANAAYIVNNNIDKKSSYPVHLQDAYIVKNFKHKKIDSAPTQTIEEGNNELNTSSNVSITKEVKSINEVSVEQVPVATAVYGESVRSETELKSQGVIEENKDLPFNTEKIFPEDSYFIGVTIGLSKLNIEENDLIGNLTLDSDPDDSGMIYGIDVGYHFNKSIFMTLDYQYTVLDDVDFNEIFTTVNYKFNETFSMDPYVGAIVGYSKMAWSQNPLNSSNNNNESSSYSGGIQIGADKYVMDQMALYLSYQYLIMNHTTNIKTFLEEKELEHTSKQTLNIGIKYYF